jgi:hypothetical protein
MKELLPLLRETQSNNGLFIVGMGLLFFVVLIKPIFFTRYFALLKFAKYIEIKQNSAVFLLYVSVLYSFCLVYFFLFLFKSNVLSLAILPTLFVLILLLILLFATQTFAYTLLWSIFQFKPGSLEELYNIISLAKTWKSILFILGFFLFYFSKTEHTLVFYGVLFGFSAFYLIYFALLLYKMKSQNILTLHGILYLFLLEIFPLLFIYNLFETW